MLYLMRVEMVINSPWIMPILGTKELASPEQTALVVSKSVVGLRFPEDSSMLLTFGIQCCWFEFKYADAAFFRDIPLNRYVVPTGRVVVPTGRYVVPAGLSIRSILVFEYEDLVGKKSITLLMYRSFGILCVS
nr:hypothetical protein [Tanacetum cinerariifolium]